ncbi:MAG TPA: riboflavin synthase [Myxococcales bacterium]|nr:riboflavin synthase [Myxococcales bacterium]
MFTGLIEDVGTVAALAQVARGGARVGIDTRLPEADLALGASIAVDGACLTVVQLEPAARRHGAYRFFADASIETLRRTTLGERKPGDPVNLERPLALGERLGGHLVLGHVDGVGRIVAREEAGEGVRFRVAIPSELLRLVVEKGSIALDGISLTVNELFDEEVGLLLIPESLRATTWGSKRVGASVNVEADILGKHVARLLGKGG